MKTLFSEPDNLSFPMSVVYTITTALWVATVTYEVLLSDLFCHSPMLAEPIAPCGDNTFVVIAIIVCAFPCEGSVLCHIVTDA